MPFAVVVTLKNINGENRIEQFIKSCQSCGWLVEQVELEASVDLYNEVQADVQLE